MMPEQLREDEAGLSGERYRPLIKPLTAGAIGPRKRMESPGLS